MDKLSKQAEFIESHLFENVDELLEHVSLCEEKLVGLAAQRHALHSKKHVQKIQT